MNKKIKFLILFFIVNIINFVNPTEAKAETIQGEISDYNVNVDVRDDGLLNVKCEITWKVLDSESPLEWVKIKVPNKQINEIKALSDNISDVYYYEDDGQQYIRIDFNKKYNTSEIIIFKYSILQGDMYSIDKDTNEATFNFTPGWFDDVEVKNLTVKWNTNKVQMATTEVKDRDYYYWHTPLEKGDRLITVVKYPASAYSFNTDNQRCNNINYSATFITIGFVFLFIILLKIKCSRIYRKEVYPFGWINIKD